MTGLFERAPVGVGSGHAAARQRKGVSSRHIRCMITASFLATAILAFFRLLRCAIFTPRARVAVHCPDRVQFASQLGPLRDPMAELGNLKNQCPEEVKVKC